MKLQLTKTKTIELDFSRRSPSRNDIAGVELFADGLSQVPAVRLTRKKSGWRLADARMIAPPDGELPSDWAELTHQATWELPHPLQASTAAIAVNSPAGSFAYASADAILREMSEPQSDSAAIPAAGGGEAKRRFAVRRGDKPVKPAAEPQATATNAPAPVKVAELPAPGTPQSCNGRRFAVRPSAEEGFHLAASLPEYQALWLSRLLPEGHRPTAGSILLAESALMASILLQPEFRAAGGNALVIFVRGRAVYFAGYKAFAPVLWRRCPGVAGEAAIREAVKSALGVGEELIDSVLDDSLVDPRSALEPLLQPVVEQLDLARAYLAGKHALACEQVFLCGLAHGADFWRETIGEALHLKLTPLAPFAGIDTGKVAPSDAHRYLGALGAAIAAMEAEL